MLGENNLQSENTAVQAVDNVALKPDITIELLT